MLDQGRCLINDGKSAGNTGGSVSPVPRTKVSGPRTFKHQVGFTGSRCPSGTGLAEFTGPHTGRSERKQYQPTTLC